MKEPREDDERLSALLEGRVEGRQREELLAHLAGADDDYEVFANTASVLRALEEEDARARRPVAPPSMRRRTWPAARTLVAMAGAVVLLLAVGWMFRGRSPSPSGDPVQLALDVDTTKWSPWEAQGNVRGGDEPSSRDARAVYAGAKLVDLAVAVRIRDTAQIGDLARTLQSRLYRHTGPDAPLSRMAAHPGAPTDSLNALVKEATERYDRRSRPALELGAWIEAARLAALAQDAARFPNGASAGMLGRAERLARGDQDAEAAVRAVHEALPRNGDADWDVLARRLEAMLARLAKMGAPSASA